MDLAALAFSIDSSDTLKAVQALDALRQTTQATTQANQDLQTQGDFLVTSMSNQGAGAARLSRQLGEIGDRFQDLITQAEKARSAFDGSTASFDAWDVAQNKVEALGRAYGTTARGLDAYLQTANQLQMSSTQAAASVQRLTMALENQGAAAAAIRQTLSNNGVSINDLQTDQIDTLLTRIKSAFQNKPDTQQRTNDLRSVLGTFDPDVIGTFTNPNYVPINQVRDIERRSATDLDVSRENSANRGLLRNQQENDQKLADYGQTFGEAQLFGLPLGYSHRNPSSFVSSDDLGTLRRSAPADSAFARDGTDSDAGKRAFYEQVQGTDISGDRSKFTAEQRIAAQVRDRQDATWLPGNTRDWSRYLGSGKVSANDVDIERRRNDELDSATSFLQRPGINLTAYGRQIQNIFHDYTPTAKPAPDPTALDQEGTGITLAGFGDNRIQRFQAAQSVLKSLGTYQRNTGGDTLEAAGKRRATALGTFTSAYGADDGTQNFRAAEASAAADARTAYSDTGAVDEANISLGLSKMSVADSAKAKSFIDYARQRHVPASALAGQSLSDLMDPAKSAGGNLPAGLLDTFNRQRDTNVQANTNEFDRGMGVEMGNLSEQGAAAGFGSAALQDRVTYQTAYAKALTQTFDATEANRRAALELSKVEAERSVQLKATIGDMEAQNRQADKYNQTMAGFTEAGSTRTAASMTANLQTEAANMKRKDGSAFSGDDQEAYIKARQTAYGTDAVKGAQDIAASTEKELRNQQAITGAASQRVSVQDKLARDMQIEDSFSKSMAEALASEASVRQRNVDIVQQAIDKTKQLKGAVAELNIEAKAFKLGADADRAIQSSRERMSHPPSQRGLYDFQAPVRDLEQQSQGGGSMSRQQFMDTFAPQALRIAPRTGDAPESILAHWGQETGWGQHMHDFNVGNITAGKGYAGATTTRGDTDANGNPYTAEFRKYQSPAQSADDYAALLQTPRYAGALGAGTDTAKFAQGLKTGGWMANPNAVQDITNSAKGLDLRGYTAAPEPAGGAAAPGGASAQGAIAGAAERRRAEYEEQGRSAQQEINEQDARSKRGFNAALPFVAKGDQVGAARAQAGQVNDADPRGLDVAQAEAKAKLLEQDRDYARQLAATSAATKITIDNNKEMAVAYGTSTDAVQKLQDKQKVEAEARTTQMSDQEKLARLTDLATQRMTQQTAATEQQAKAMRDSSSDQKAINDLGPFASETALQRRQTELDVAKHDRDTPGQSDDAKRDYKTAADDAQSVRETTRSINDYKSAWESAQSASFSALNSVITTGGKATDVVAGLAKSLAQIGLNTIEKSAGNWLTDLIGGGLKLGGSAVSGPSDFLSAATVPVSSVPLAMGGAFVGGQRVRAFAAGGLIDRPTHFYSAGGETNLAGEMGTEAIMPLKRMPNGDLGVATGGGSGGGGGVTVHAPITIQGNGNGGGGSSAPDQHQLDMMQMKLKEAVRQAVVAALVDEKRAGGSLY